MHAIAGGRSADHKDDELFLLRLGRYQVQSKL
jgi:hypothetical protein